MDKFRKLGVKAKNVRDRASDSGANYIDQMRNQSSKISPVKASSTIDGSIITVFLPKNEAFGFQLDNNHQTVYRRTGFRVRIVSPCSFAESVAHIRAGDLLVSVNELKILPATPWTDVANLIASGHKSKQPLKLLFFREPLKQRRRHSVKGSLKKHRRRLPPSQHPDDMSTNEDKVEELSLEERIEQVAHELDFCKNRNTPRARRLECELRGLLRELKQKCVKRKFGPRGSLPLFGELDKKKKSTRRRRKLSLRNSRKSASEEEETNEEHLLDWFSKYKDLAELEEPDSEEPVDGHHGDSENNNVDQARKLRRQIQRKLDISSEAVRAMKAKRNTLKCFLQGLQDEFKVTHIAKAKSKKPRRRRPSSFPHRLDEEHEEVQTPTKNDEQSYVAIMELISPSSVSRATIEEPCMSPRLNSPRNFETQDTSPKPKEEQRRVKLRHRRRSRRLSSDSTSSLKPSRVRDKKNLSDNGSIAGDRSPEEDMLSPLQQELALRASQRLGDEGQIDQLRNNIVEYEKRVTEGIKEPVVREYGKKKSPRKHRAGVSVRRDRLVHDETEDDTVASGKEPDALDARKPSSVRHGKASDPEEAFGTTKIEITDEEVDSESTKTRKYGKKKSPRRHRQDMFRDEEQSDTMSKDVTQYRIRRKSERLPHTEPSRSRRRTQDCD